MGILNNPAILGIEIRECGEPLVLLDELEFVIEPMYFNWGYSDTNLVKLREGVITKLRQARAGLPAGWNFKIWDGYRTLATQKILYDNYWDELKVEHPDWSDEQLHAAVQIFVAPPSRDPSLPAPHNTGGAVDLTLVDEYGRDIPMGTAFDEFNIKSYTDHFKNNSNGISQTGESAMPFHRNRMLLKRSLGEVGFRNYHEEWWHFSFGDQNWARQAEAEFAIYGSMELK